MPMGDELKRLLKEGDGHISENSLSRKQAHPTQKLAHPILKVGPPKY